MKARTSATASIFFASVLLCPTIAAAQFDPFMPVPIPPVGPAQPAPETVAPQRGQTVTERPRPLFDPLGVRLEEFFLYPRLELDESFNDNIFATPSTTKSDFITDLKPRLDLVSNFGQHALTVSAGADLGWYASHSTENYQDAFTSANGRYDIDQGQHIFANAAVDRLHVARTSPDFPGAAAAPPIYTTYLAGLGYGQDQLPVTYRGDISVARSEYQAVPEVGGGQVNQSDRNNTTYTLGLQAGYSLDPNWGMFARGSGNFRDFDHGASAANPRRNSAGYHADVGAHVDFGVLFGEAYIGYLEQDYQNGIYHPIQGIDAGAKVVWNVTGLDTLKLNALRSVQDTSQEVIGAGLTSPGYLHSMVGLSLDHELSRNVLLNANADYVNDDFKGISRTDNGIDAGAGVKFLLRRDLYLGGSYTYSHRDSSGAQATHPFSQNIFMLRIATQL
ncbi:MAG TPA: outer membrane beta-barrel protein [Stellaceae bacterium]|nr:outer membrane beta-barrel protein [Stellaceae bacterium]